MFSVFLHLKIQFVGYFCVYLTKLNTFDICSIEAWEWVGKGWVLRQAYKADQQKKKKIDKKSFELKYTFSYPLDLLHILCIHAKTQLVSKL